MANAPRSYRDVISTALRVLRPRFEVLTIEPERLQDELPRLSPHVVVCSRATRLVDREALAWVELYPDGAPGSLVSLAGRKVAHPGMDFDDLLSVLDEAERLLAVRERPTDPA